MIELLPPNPLIESASCSHFNSGNCRSCSLLGLPNGQRQASKLAPLEKLFSCPVETLAGVEKPFATRTKAKMIVSGTVKEPVVGLLNDDTSGRMLVDCPLHMPKINETIEFLPQLIRDMVLTPYDIAHRKGELKAVIIRSNQTQTSLMVRFVLRSKELIPHLTKSVARLRSKVPEISVVSANIQPVHQAILEGPEEIILTDESIFWDTCLGEPLAYSPQAFSQVTPEVSEKLVHTVQNRVRHEIPRTTVLDLYCGVGSFALSCASASTSVLGIEQTASAIACANLSAKARGLQNQTSFRVADVDIFLKSVSQSQPQFKPDVVIVNPPRRGLNSSIINGIMGLQPSLILYSSCNPESLARDVQEFKLQFTLRKIMPFDMFPLTHHLEILAELHFNGRV